MTSRRSCQSPGNRSCPARSRSVFTSRAGGRSTSAVPTLTNAVTATRSRSEQVPLCYPFREECAQRKGEIAAGSDNAVGPKSSIVVPRAAQASADSAALQWRAVGEGLTIDEQAR